MGAADQNAAAPGAVPGAAAARCLHFFLAAILAYDGLNKSLMKVKVW